MPYSVLKLSGFGRFEILKYPFLARVRVKENERDTDREMAREQERVRARESEWERVCK